MGVVCGCLYPELRLQGALGQHALDDVGPVQAVHAVAAKRAVLMQQHLPICVHQEVSASTHTALLLMQSAYMCTWLVAHANRPKFILHLSDHIQQDLQAVPPHPTALLMEVKGDVPAEKARR